MKEKVYIICGPTASGKSSMAINLALSNNGVIINADSQQVYRELPILTACPSKKDYETVPHKLYQFYDGTKKMDAAIWIEYAKKEIEEALNNGKTPYIVGGTGFYIKALTEGLSVIPTIPQNIREQVRKEGLHAKNTDLYEILKKYDPDLCKKVQPSDRQRVLRGIEVFRATGTPLSSWQRQKKIKPLPDVDFDLKIIDFEMPELEKRIKLRTEEMFKMGVVDEVKNLLSMDYPDNASVFKIIGVETIWKYLSNTITLEEAKSELILLTRQYAKRQRTFFRTQLSK
ncbi:MAG: tRNA (adenosine(37)-N6)-dimethylallyltransferase MiaA [Alphaproteobacteria bacterium]|nr:tRNA (adenosine(37)-N6)-dimethylallyltransferase MiaA [Alphaproteobacteria bacterium]